MSGSLPSDVQARILSVEQWELRILDPKSYCQTQRNMGSMAQLPSSFVQTWLKLVVEAVEAEGFSPTHAFFPPAWQSVQLHVGRELMLWLRPCLEELASCSKGELHRLQKEEERVLRSEEACKAFLERFAGMRHVIARLLRQWNAYLLQFLQVLERDRMTLMRELAWMDMPGKILQVGVGLDHGFERMVWLLTFDKGQQVVYKPRDLSLDEAYGELLESLRELEPSLSLQSCFVLNRGGYGWMEDKRPRPLQTATGAQRFYQRSGCLLALCYVLRSQRIHFTNIMACDEQPILVDAETLLAPVFPGQDWRSVMRRSLMLPEYGADHLQHYSHGSGIGVDCDFTPLDLVNATASSGPPNLPEWQGNYLGAEDYKKDVCAGFELMWKLLLRLKEKKGGSDALLHHFYKRAFRVNLRSSESYRSISESCQKAVYLESVDALSKQLREKLKKADSEPGQPPPDELLIDEELRFLLEGKQPLFQATLDSRHLYEGERLVKADFFPKSHLVVLRKHIEGMCHTQLSPFKGYIYHSLLSSRLTAHADLSLPARVEDGLLDCKDPTYSELIHMSEQVGTALQERLVEKYSELEARKFLLDTMPLNGYFGLSGIALFFAMLAERTQQKRWKVYSSQLLEHIEARFGKGSFREKGAVYEGLRGRGSLLFALRAIGDLLPESAAQFSARRLAQQWLKQNPSFKEKGGLMCSEQGTLLAILGMRGVNWQEPAMLTLRSLYQEMPHLLQQASSSESLVEKLSIPWGAAGSAYLLYRLGEALGESAAVATGLNALQLLTASGLEQVSREGVLKEVNASYGYVEGMAGSCLALLDAGSHISPSLLSSLIRDTEGFALDFHEGALSLLHTQYMAGWTLGDPLLRSQARIQLSQRMAQTRLEELQHPGLMKGISGLGYLLLTMSQDKHCYANPLLLRQRRGDSR